jgi:DNA-binding MarR family transcriptional regulator/N-acetylglutamate synthase-like GNAT family acetyltransferase
MATMVDAELRRQVDAVRRFSRFYTRRIGVLQEGLLGSDFSLAEGRVLYELAQRPAVTAAALGASLGMDAGYLSRLLAGFARRRLVRKEPSPTDGRQSLLSLTATGEKAFRALDAASAGEIAGLLADLGAGERRQLGEALATVERLLSEPAAARQPFVLRPPRAGDLGWVVARHGALYAREYGWDERFEALVARIVADFVDQLQPRRERCWIAEVDGEPVGSVFLVRDSDEVARLRLLLVEPGARGLGIGRRLVDECLAFAAQAGYRRITLWTNSCLDAARHIYEAAGFQLVEEKPHQSFGHDLVGQTWERSVEQPGDRSIDPSATPSMPRSRSDHAGDHVTRRR